MDDHATFRDIAARFLEQQSAGELTVVDSVSTGEEALASAARLHPRVVLMDLRMPGLGGLEAIPRLRRIVPDAAIIVVSVFDGESYRRASLDVHADDFVSKSNMTTHLLPAIRRAVLVPRGSEAQ